MVGQSFTYRKETFTLLEYALSSSHVKLTLDDRDEPLVIHKDDLKGMLDQFHPSAGNLTITPKAKEVNPYLDQPPVNKMAGTIIGQNAAWLSETIKANIIKLQSDPSFIPQAEAINSQVKSFLDLAKTEVDMQKAINKIETGL